MPAQTLYDKIWDAHLVAERPDGTGLLYIDRHLLHEVTSPQAFEGLRLAGRRPWRLDANLAAPDHNVPTIAAERRQGVAGIADEVARIQVQTLDENCTAYGIRQFDIADVRQGIVHVVGPEQGATLPGMTIVCGDSHTSTHGAFAALAQGIGTSEVEHVLATQTLLQQKTANMRIVADGQLGEGVFAKDLVLAIIGVLGTAGGTGYTLEFSGEAIRGLSMEGRMTVCNMAIEAGARAGLVSVDEKTINYLKNLPFSPENDAWDEASAQWRALVSDPDATFDAEIHIAASEIEPQVTWGTSPGLVGGISDDVPDPECFADEATRETARRALAYMGLEPGTPMTAVPIDRAFIGSCTNARIEDLRAAAEVVRGRQVASSVTQALVVPGSGLVKAAAEAEGLAQVFVDAGFEWREPGCSMCLAMNADRLQSGERCASTSNRNFEGRQGHGGRTHLVSPAMAAAAAIAGHFTDARDMLGVSGESGVSGGAHR